MLPTVSVLIVSFNVREYLLQAIDSVKNSNYNGSIEIIVVDNDSFDGTPLSVQKKYPDIHVLKNNRNQGFGTGINQAAQKAKGEFLFILNPDTIVQENTIEKLRLYLKNNPQVGIVGPKVLNSDGSLQLASKRSMPTVSVSLPKILGLSTLFPKSKWAGKYNLTYLEENKIHKVDAVSGSALMIRKSSFDKLNGFDETFFMYGEDLDLCKRIIQLGKEIHYVPTTQIIHYGGESVRSAKFDSINAFFDSMSLFYKKHFSATTTFFLSILIKLGIWLKKSIAFLKEWKSQIISILLDSILVSLSYLTIYYIKFFQNESFIFGGWIFLTGCCAIWLFTGYMYHLYGKNILSYHHACYAGVTGLLITLALNSLIHPLENFRFVLVIGSLTAMVLMPGWRLVAHYLFLKLYGKRIGDKHNLLFTHRTLILGLPSHADSVILKLREKIDSGIDIIGICSKKLFSENNKWTVPILGSVKRLGEIIRSYRIKELIFLSDSFSNKEILSLIEKTKRLKVIYRIVPRETDILIGKASVDHFGDLSLVSVDIAYHKIINRIVKRLFDIFFAFAGMVLLSPIILFKVLRKKIIKIRFWDSDGKQFPGFIFSQSQKKSLQFLPLLWSIFSGRMSFVGGALVPVSDPDPKLSGKPGLTGIYRLKNIKPHEDSYKQAEYYYLQNQGLLLDLELLVMTVFTVGK
jgi:hypothetical protein